MTQVDEVTKGAVGNVGSLDGPPGLKGGQGERGPSGPVVYNQAAYNQGYMSGRNAALSDPSCQGFN